MIVTCKCQHCGNELEFEPEEFPAGSAAICPNCQKETELSFSPPPAKPIEPVIMIKCACDKCGSNVAFEASNEGTWVNCPHCEQPTKLQAPPKAAPLKAYCRVCGKNFTFDPKTAAHFTDCPHCGDRSLSEIYCRPPQAEETPTGPCVDCNRLISRRARFCPHCGSPKHEIETIFYYAFYGTIFVTLIGAVITLICWGIIVALTPTHYATFPSL